MQFPYDLDLEGKRQSIELVSSDGTVLANARTYQDETPCSLMPLTYLLNRAVAFKMDGSPITKDNPVRSGDTIRVSVVGADLTSPPIETGELPVDGMVLTPVDAIRAAIGGKVARVVRQALSPDLIGVTGVDVLVPNLASDFYALQIANNRSQIGRIPIWVVN